MTEEATSKPSSSTRLRSGVDAGLLRQLGDATTAIFLLRDYDKFGLTERVGYHFDLTEALGVSASAREETKPLTHDDHRTSEENESRENERKSADTATVSSHRILCGVAGLLECAPATPWHRLSKRQKRALKVQLRAFNASAERIRTDSQEDILCYQPATLPLRFNPSTRLFFAYEITRIAFCVDASPSMTSTFGINGSAASPGHCCPLDRLPDMARTFFASLAEPVSAPSLVEGGVWKPILAVTVLAVFPLGKKAETSLLVRDYRVDSVEAAHVLADQIKKWVFHDVEDGIAERLSRKHAFSTWSMPLYSSSLRVIFEACDYALSVLSSAAKPIIVVATDGRSVSCDGVVNVFLDVDRIDIPVIVLDVSPPETHVNSMAANERAEATGGIKTEWNFLTYDPGGPADFPLHLSDDTEALYAVCRATDGLFLDSKLLEETAKSVAGQASVETSTPYNFSYKRRFAKMNGLQWLTLFSLSPLSPTIQSSGATKLAPPSHIIKRRSLESEAVATSDPLIFSRHASFTIRSPNELRSLDSNLSILSTKKVPTSASPSQSRVTFSTYFVSPVRIKALLMTRIKEGYRARQYGTSTNDADKVFIQFFLALDDGTALHYEVSFKSLPGQIHEVGSAHIKIELSGDTNFVQTVKKEFLTQNEENRPSTMAQKVSSRLCQVMRWIRREDILQSYVSPPAKWGDQLSSPEAPLARRLGSMSNLQRQRHFRSDEFDVVCTGQLPYVLEDDAVFSEFASKDNGEQELLDLIQDWSTQVVNRAELRFAKAQTSSNGTTSYYLVEIQQSHIAPRLFTIRLDFLGGTDPRKRLQILSALQNKLELARDVDVLRKQLGPFLLSTSDGAAGKSRNVEFQYHHAHWELVKDPELLPLVMKRRIEIGHFRLMQSSDSSAIFAKVVPENLVDIPGDLVQYQITIHPHRVEVDLHMESECGAFFPFSSTKGEKKRFNGMVNVIRRRDQECGRALRSRTNLFRVLSPDHVEIDPNFNESHTDSVKRMLQYSSRVTRKVRFFQPSAAAANGIFFEMIEKLIVQNTFGVKAAKLSIDRQERLKEEDPGVWFIVDFDGDTMSMVHLSSVDIVTETSAQTLRTLSFFTSGISDLYSKRDDTNDEDSINSHISEHMPVTEFADFLEDAERGTFASAAYMALRYDLSAIDRFERDDLDAMRETLEFAEVANLTIAGQNVPAEYLGDSKLIRLVQTILTPIPGDDECLFYSGSDLQNETFRISDDESEPSNDEEEKDDNDSPDVSTGSQDPLQMSLRLSSGDDVVLSDNDLTVAAPIFFRFKLDGVVVPFYALSNIQKSSTLTAEVSTSKGRNHSPADLPWEHQVVAAELNVSLKWYAAEQVIERLRHYGTQISKENLKTVQKCMQRIQNTISFSIDVYFYVLKTDTMVPASAPAGGESQVGKGFSLLHEELSKTSPYLFHSVSPNGYFVSVGDGISSLDFWCFVYFHINDGIVTSQMHHPGGETEGVKEMNHIHDAIRTSIHRVNQQLLLDSLHRNRAASSLLIPSFKKKVTVVTDSDEYEESDATTAGEIFIPGSFACPVVFRTVFDLFHRCATNPGQVARTLEATVLHNFAVSNRSGIFVYKDESDQIFYMRLQARGSGIDGDGKVELLVHGINEPGPSVTEQLKVLLQRRLLMIAVEMLSAVLTKNPHFRVGSADLEFLRSFEKDWSNLGRDSHTQDPAEHYYEFPEFVYDPTMVLLMFRQNLCGSTFFHRLNDIGYERLSPSVTESQRMENGGSVLKWNNHDFTLYYNNAPTKLDQSFQGVSTLTEKGAELSRQIGSGIAMIEILLIRADGTPLDEVIFAEPINPNLEHKAKHLEASCFRFQKLQNFPSSSSNRVCVRIRVTDTALARGLLHEWIELTLNQAMTAWVIERELERSSATEAPMPRSVPHSGDLSGQFGDKRDSLTSHDPMDSLCPGLGFIRIMLQNLYTLPHPAVSQITFDGAIRSSSVATKTMETLERCIFGTLFKDSTNIAAKKVWSMLRIVRTSRSSPPELVQLSWDSSAKRHAIAHGLQHGVSFSRPIHDSPIDCPEYICFFQMKEFGNTPKIIDENIRLYKEVMIHDGISDRSATIDLLESLKAVNQRAFSRSFAFILSTKRNRRILATYNWLPGLVKSVNNRLQESENASLEKVGRSCYSLQHRTLKYLSPPTKVQAAKVSQVARSSSAAAIVPLRRHPSAEIGAAAFTSGSAPAIDSGRRRRIPRPVTIRQPKLIGKSVEGGAMKAMAASRQRASSKQFKNMAGPAPLRRPTKSQVSSREDGKSTVSNAESTVSEGGGGRNGRALTGVARKSIEKKKVDEETNRMNVDFTVVYQQMYWKARRPGSLQRDSIVYLSSLWWPKQQTETVPKALVDVVMRKSPIAWSDVCPLPPFPSGLGTLFVSLFTRWLVTVAPNMTIVNITNAVSGASKEEEYMVLASVIKNVHGVKGLVVMKISRSSGKRPTSIIRSQGWLLRLPRRTRRDKMKKSRANVTSTCYAEKDSTGLDLLSSDVHRSLVLESLLFDFSASMIERAVRFSDDRVDFNELTSILRSLLGRYTLEQQKRIPLLNYRVFEARVVLKSYKNEMINKFDSSRLLQELSAEAKERDLIVCGTTLCFKRGVNLKGSYSLCFLTPDPAESDCMRLIILCRTQGRNLSDYMFREASNVAIHIIDNIVFEFAGLLHDELSYIAEKLHKDAVWQSFTTRSSRPRKTLAHVNELLELCSIYSALPLMGNARDGSASVMASLLGPNSVLDWRSCCLSMKKERSFGPCWSFSGSHQDTHLFYLESCGNFLLLELSRDGKELCRADIVEKEEESSSSKSRQTMSIQVFANFLLHFLWQSL